MCIYQNENFDDTKVSTTKYCGWLSATTASIRKSIFNDTQGSDIPMLKQNIYSYVATT